MDVKQYWNPSEAWTRLCQRVCADCTNKTSSRLWCTNAQGIVFETKTNTQHSVGFWMIMSSFPFCIRGQRVCRAHKQRHTHQCKQSSDVCCQWQYRRYSSSPFSASIFISLSLFSHNLVSESVLKQDLKWFQRISTCGTVILKDYREFKTHCTWIQCWRFNARKPPNKGEILKRGTFKRTLKNSQKPNAKYLFY